MSFFMKKIVLFLSIFIRVRDLCSDELRYNVHYVLSQHTTQQSYSLYREDRISMHGVSGFKEGGKEGVEGEENG